MSSLIIVVRSFKQRLGLRNCFQLAVLAFGNITGDSLRCRDLVLGHGALLPLLALFNKPVSLSTLRNATWTLSMFCEAPFDQCVISHQALPCLVNLLTNNYEKRIKNVACWTISNITAGNEEQIQVVIETDIITPLVHLLQNAEFDIKKQAAWAIKNATSGGTHDQIRFLVSQGCIKPLCDLLNCPDPEVVTVCLQGLENILKVGEVDKNMGTTGAMMYA